MGALFSRVKVWKRIEILLNTDLNAEFNNILTNLIPIKLDDYSATVSQMQETLSPGSVGSEVQATNLAEEIKQLRYMLKLFSGEAQWYEAPAASLLELEALIQNPVPSHRIISGRKDANNQPMFIVPHGTNPTVTLDCTPTAFVATINGESRTYSADLQITTLQTAPGSNNTCAVNDASLAGAQSTRFQGEWGTTITIGTIGSEISSRNGKYAAFLKGSEVFLAEIDTTNNVLKNCIRGYCFDNADAWLSRETLSNTNTITLLQATWLFATYNSDTPSLDVCYNRPYYGYDQPTSPSIGDYWFDFSADRWKKYSGVSWDAQEAMPIGFCAQSSTGCIAARSFDFYKPVSDVNTVEIERVDASNARSTRQVNRLSVYGALWAWDSQWINWNMTSDLDTGTTDSASVTFYLYVTDTGDVKISNVKPHDRRNDLLGAYHPAKPWRCVAEIANDSGSALDAATLSHAGYSRPPMGSRFVDLSMMGVSVNKASSSSSGSYTRSGTLQDVTNLSVTLTTKGRPVDLFLVGAEGSTTGQVYVTRATSTTANGFIKFVRTPSGGSPVSLPQYTVGIEVDTSATENTLSAQYAPSMFRHTDGLETALPAGTYTWKVQAGSFLSTIGVTDCILVAIERT